MKTLKIEDLSKNFGSTEVLKKINLEIDEGNFLVLLGPSGCGKSTLLNIIAGLETINEGNVFIDGLNEDILTKHLLKLNEIEDQFRELTNKFEEVNFKLDKLSSRVTKIQSDNQLRFSDLENLDTEKKKTKAKKILPGSSQPADFGANPGYSVSSLPEKQETSSIESAQTVITEEPEERESLLPDKPAKEQYEFAVSFMKIGDYETAEFALKEFIQKNKEHDLAGNAQYWYGETLELDNFTLMLQQHILMVIKIIQKVKRLQIIF